MSRPYHLQEERGPDAETCLKDEVMLALIAAICYLHPSRLKIAKINLWLVTTSKAKKTKP